jgi:hypothetical protein
MKRHEEETLPVSYFNAALAYIEALEATILSGADLLHTCQWVRASGHFKSAATKIERFQARYEDEDR